MLMKKDLAVPGNVEYVPYKNRIHSHGNGNFSEQEVRLSDTPLYFAEGFEKLFLALYFISLPYIAGLLFLFIYISEGDYKLFISLDQSNSFILTWAIGYEILAGLTLLYIIKSAIVFVKALGRNGKKQKFQIP